jgi:hypothetical protein
VNGVIQFEGAWINRTLSQGGELGVAILEAANVRCVGCRAAFGFQVAMAFRAAPLARGANRYAPAVFAVAGSASEAFDLVGVMDGAIVATQASGVGGFRGKSASLRRMARCALLFEDSVRRGHSAATVNA